MGLEIPIAWLTVLLFGSLALLLSLGLPMAFCTGSLAVIFLFIFGTPEVLNMLPSRIFPFMTDYQLSAVPLFIFMAAILEKAGIIEELFDVIYKWLGSLKGGLASATVVACTLLAAMVGVVGATEVTMGMIALPAMLRRGYDPKLACGSLLAGGTLGILIPPSVMAIVYAVVAQQSLGELLIGSVFPGPAALGHVRRSTSRSAATSNPSLGPGAADGGARRPAREVPPAAQHDRADPADPARARRHLLRRRDAGRGGRHRHLRRARGLRPPRPPELDQHRGRRDGDPEGHGDGDVDLLRRDDVRRLLHRQGRPDLRRRVDPRHRPRPLRHPAA